MQNKTILMICSWVSADGFFGIFFREQAKLMIQDYNMLLASFSHEDIGFWKAIKRILKFKNLITVVHKVSQEGLDIYHVTYPKFICGGKIIDNIVKRRAVIYLYNHLVNSMIKIDLIHAQTLFNAGFWAYEFNFLYNVPYLLTEHNQISLKNCDDKDFEKINHILKESKANLVVSNDKIRQFATNQIFCDFINVGNTINEDFFYFEDLRDNNVFRIITIGAFAEIKDHLTMFKALELFDDFLNNKIKKCIFTWIGCDTWSLKLKNADVFIEQFNFKNISVELIGKADRNEISYKLKQSNVFLFTSISEGMPVSVLESLACGTPVVTTNCGGVEEIINDKNGRILPIREYQNIAQELIMIFENYNFDNKQISEIANKQFGNKVFHDKMFQIYDSIIKDVN